MRLGVELSYPINKATDTDTLFNIMLTCLWLVNYAHLYIFERQRCLWAAGEKHQHQSDRESQEENRKNS